MGKLIILKRGCTVWQGEGGRRVAESLVFGEGGDRGEGLPTFGTLDLQPTVRVHTFVATQIAELRVRLEAHLALEGLDGGVDVGVLLQARAGGEGLPTFRAGVRACPRVLVTDVLLQDHGVGEDPRAVLTRVSLVLPVKRLVLDEVGAPGEGSRAVVAAVLAGGVPVRCDQVFVQPAGGRRTGKV